MFFFQRSAFIPITRSNLQSRESVDKGVDGCATAVCAHPRLRLAHPRLRLRDCGLRICGICHCAQHKGLLSVNYRNESLVLSFPIWSCTVLRPPRAGARSSMPPVRAVIAPLPICTLAIGYRDIFRDCGCASFALALPTIAFCLSLAVPFAFCVFMGSCFFCSLLCSLGTAGAGVVRPYT